MNNMIIRQCYACGSHITYITNNGWSQWYLNHDIDNNMLCRQCFYIISQIKYKQRHVLPSLREDLFDLLGHICKCGFSDKRALQFDHVSGGGTKEVKKFKGAATMYRFYLNNPELARRQLQVLCANCNWIKLHENGEKNY